MYDLSSEQRLKLTTVLMEYLNAGDWKALFLQTDCEAFAQQRTQFYQDVSWENENLEQDCIDAVEFILNKDSKHLKTIWEIAGVQTMIKRKDEGFYSEIEALIKLIKSARAVDSSDSLENTVSNAIVFAKNQNSYQAIDNAETLLISDDVTTAFNFMHAVLQDYLQHLCTSKNITFDNNDAITVLLAKVTDYIKRHADTDLNEKTLSILRTITLMIDTINDLPIHNMTHQNENLPTQVDVKFAISLTRSIMHYLDDLLAK